jgi:hypothetical protein
MLVSLVPVITCFVTWLTLCRGAEILNAGMALFAVFFFDVQLHRRRINFPMR